jgi:predicted PolB exonuclease-like 3'-5' exonuclease
MTKSELKEVLRSAPGYLKSGSKTLSKKFNISRNTAKDAVREVNIELAHPITPFKRMIFDIETSPNVGWFWRASWKTSIGTHQILEERKVICISWKWEHEEAVHNLVWDTNKDDTEMLTKFVPILMEADEVVGHNGDSFDIPWLRTRCLMKGLPFPTYVKSLDTLRKVRSMFNFQSNRLDYIAKVMGLGGKIPIAPSVWNIVCFSPVDSEEYKAGIAEMLEYCDYDVVLLEDVFHKLLQYIKPNTHVGIAQGKPRHSCPNCGGEDVKYVKHTVTASGIIKRNLECNTCKSDYMVGNQVFLNMLK